MSTHSLFSPSSAHRWMPCPGSMAFPENQEQGGSSTFADDGTASHEWAAKCLSTGKNAIELHGEEITLNGKQYVMDEERASFVQDYLDDVRRRALGGHLFVEQRVDLSPWLGEGQGGTSDAVIFQPAQKLLIVEDLKYGMGEKVFASDNGAINPQLGLYALGALRDAELLGDIETVRVVVHQPRLGHVDEFDISVSDLLAFGELARLATVEAGHAMVLPGSPDLQLYLNPSDKACRWCRAKHRCPKLAAKVAEEVRADFETIVAEPPPALTSTAELSKAMAAVPLIEDWCRAVRAQVVQLVTEGVEVLGVDGKPYKFVDGKQGNRTWSDEVQAEATLLGVLPPEKAYQPQKLITASAAAKLLDKKATKQTWKDVFEPLIKRAPGKPLLVLGSDPRPPVSGGASAEDFDEIQAGD